MLIQTCLPALQTAGSALRGVVPFGTESGWKPGQRECSGQSNDQNRNRGLPDHPFGGAADQDIGDSAVAVGAHDDEITLLFLRGLDDKFSRVSVFD